MSDIVAFLAKQALVGFFGAAAFVGLLMTFDVAGIGTLILESDMAVLATAMMTMFIGFTFASIQMGIAVMSVRDPGDRR